MSARKLPAITISPRRWPRSTSARRSRSAHAFGRYATARTRFDLDRVTRRQARAAIATVLKMESWCDERATERRCARTVDAPSIRVRCDGSRADPDAPASDERTLPIRVEGPGGFVTAPRIRRTRCGGARRGRRARPGDTRAVRRESLDSDSQYNEPSQRRQLPFSEGSERSRSSPFTCHIRCSAEGADEPGSRQ